MKLVNFFPSVKPILQKIFPLPSKPDLLIFLHCQKCNFAADAAYQLSVPENFFMSSKTSGT